MDKLFIIGEKMYLTEHFKEDDLDQIKSIVEHFPLATCVSSIGDGTVRQNEVETGRVVS